MNIICINHEYPPIGGGGATACQKIAGEYVKAGHSVTIVTSAFAELPSEEMENSVRILRVSCKRKAKDHSSFLEMLSFIVSAHKTLKKLVQEETFDICQIYFGIPSGPLGYWMKKVYHIPYIVRLGGGDVPGGQKRFDKIYMIIGPFLKKIWKEAAYVVSNSEGLLNRAKAFSTDAKFDVIPNGIDPEDFPERDTENSDGIFRICSVARILERKGLQHVIEALPDLKQLTDGKIQYTIIGDGPYRSTLEELCRSRGVDDIVSITGFIDRRKVLEMLSEYDVFVLPSYREGMPNVVLEAMASGLPIIMTDCEGSGELITDNGIVVSLKSDITKEIGKALSTLEADKTLRRGMGKKSRERVKMNFTWNLTAQKYMQMFERILEG